jgi:hypothetical protein
LYCTLNLLKFIVMERIITYISPEITILEIQMEQCLALSNFEYDDEGFEY